MVRPDLDWSDCKLWILGLKPRAKCSEKFSHVNRKLTCNTVCTVASSWCFSHFSVISQKFLTYFLTFPVSQLFLTYFPLISLLLPSYFPPLDYFSLISTVFPKCFSLLNYFSVTFRLLLDYFPVTSWLSWRLSNYFPTTSQLFEWTKPAPEPLIYELLTS